MSNHSRSRRDHTMTVKIHCANLKITYNSHNFTQFFKQNTDKTATEYSYLNLATK